MTLTFLKTPVGQEPVIVEGVFNTTSERMFAAWTTPDDVQKWFGPGPGKLERVEIDLTEGGAWRFAYARDEEGKTHQLSGQYEEISPPKRLVYSWIHTLSFEDGQTKSTDASRVSVTFEDRPDGVFVRLVHEAIKTEDGRQGVGSGWNGTFVRLQEAFPN